MNEAIGAKTEEGLRRGGSRINCDFKLFFFFPSLRLADAVFTRACLLSTLRLSLNSFTSQRLVLISPFPVSHLTVPCCYHLINDTLCHNLNELVILRLYLGKLRTSFI